MIDSDNTSPTFYDQDYFLGTSGTRGDFSLLDLDTKFVDRTETVIDYFQLGSSTQGTIAEVGCGTAPFHRLLSERADLKHIDVTCSDITKSGILLLDDAQRPSFQLAPAETLPYENDSLIGVVEWDVLEHLQRPALAIVEAYRVLKSGGFYHVVCPNPDSWRRDSVDPDKDPYRRDQSHVFPPIVTAQFLRDQLSNVGFEFELFTRGFDGQEGKNQTGLASMKSVDEDSSGTHLVVFARKIGS